ncbi:MAG: DNA repair protein RecN, partial [Burkholderiales bacterium]|nr:DNA repair protein RecN [Burkholderiales bacterium]
ARRDTLATERERLAWQIGELERLAPADGQWDAINAEHGRLAHAQALIDGARTALAAVDEADDSVRAQLARALAAVDAVLHHDAELAGVAELLRGAQAQVDEASHALGAYVGHREPDPERLAELDAQIGAWVAAARRHRRTPGELPALLATWRQELQALDAAADLDALERRAAAAEAAWRSEAQRVSKQRRAAAPRLAAAVTQAMQALGMAGGRFEVALLPHDEPQAWGLEGVEFRVAGHAGSTPRALGRVASGGELSRLALAIAVTTAQRGASAALIFDEIDAGVGGAVADSVGRLMKQLGRSHQVLAVTHLAQVAACADHHFVVSKGLVGAATVSRVEPVSGEARVAEIARMLGGERLAGTSRAHAQAMLGGQSS